MAKTHLALKTDFDITDPTNSYPAWLVLTIWSRPLILSINISNGVPPIRLAILYINKTIMRITWRDNLPRSITRVIQSSHGTRVFETQKKKRMTFLNAMAIMAIAIRMMQTISMSPMTWALLNKKYLQYLHILLDPLILQIWMILKILLQFPILKKSEN